MIGKNICPACGEKSNKLVNHHWYEPPNLQYKCKKICASCNSRLVPSVFIPNWIIDKYNLNIKKFDHILPSWDIQLAYLKIMSLGPWAHTIFYRTYDIEPIPYDEKDGEYYRVTLGFDSLDEAKRNLDKLINNGDIKENYWKFDNLAKNIDINDYSPNFKNEYTDSTSQYLSWCVSQQVDRKR
jgi:hypothetical protein